MSDCGVCIGGGDWDGPNEFENVGRPKARKPHKCSECHRIIQPGEKYERFSGKFDGSLFCLKTCLQCAEIRDAFNCDGGAIVDGLWSEMEDLVFPAMTTGCLDRLETPEAKAFLLDKWRAWKGLAA
jgi:hypothetical protein